MIPPLTQGACRWCGKFFSSSTTSGIESSVAQHLGKNKKCFKNREGVTATPQEAILPSSETADIIRLNRARYRAREFLIGNEFEPEFLDAWDRKLKEAHSVDSTENVLNQLIETVAIETVAQACPQLECLCLAACGVTDAALWAVAQSCPQLKELNVSLNLVSNAAIQAVAKGCPQLKKLNVTGCINLRDEAIDSVALGCPQLECLDVFGLQDITDAAIHAVTQGCPQLKQLDMTQCAMLTESAIVSIVQSCTCLLYTSPSPRDATLSRMPSSA